MSLTCMSEKKKCLAREHCGWENNKCFIKADSSSNCNYLQHYEIEKSSESRKLGHLYGWM